MFWSYQIRKHFLDLGALLWFSVCCFSLARLWPKCTNLLDEFVKGKWIRTPDLGEKREREKKTKWKANEIRQNLPHWLHRLRSTFEPSNFKNESSIWNQLLDRTAQIAVREAPIKLHAEMENFLWFSPDCQPFWWVHYVEHYVRAQSVQCYTHTDRPVTCTAGSRLSILQCRCTVGRYRLWKTPFCFRSLASRQQFSASADLLAKF